MKAQFFIPGAVADDFRYCEKIVRQNTENFPVGSWLLPRRIRPHLYAVYAFARTADDFADHPGRSDEERLRLLDDWERRLQQAEMGAPDHPIFRALAYTLNRMQLPSQPLFDLLTAFRRDVTKKRYRNWAELVDYCRYSANPVGRVVLHLYGLADPELFPQADALCTALQLTNHWQDLGEDGWRGRPLYLPMDLMEQFGVSERLILERRFSPAVGGLVLQLTERSRQYYMAALPLISAMPWPYNLELAVTWESGMELLERIEEAGGNTLRSRPSLLPGDRLRCLWRSLRLLTQNSGE